MDNTLKPGDRALGEVPLQGRGVDQASLLLAHVKYSSPQAASPAQKPGPPSTFQVANSAAPEPETFERGSTKGL